MPRLRGAPSAIFRKRSLKAEIWLGWGDSLGVGIDARTPTLDLDWPNVFQVRWTAPTGINSDITPLDQAQTSASDFLSSYTSFARQRAADIGGAVYLVPHNFAGTSLNGTGSTWGVGQSLQVQFISRANSAISLVQTAIPGAVLGGIIQFEGSNDRGEGDPTGYKTELLAAIADMRTKIFQNGVSGADASTLPYIINGMIPEALTGAGAIDYERDLRDVASSIVNGRFYKMPEGINRTDNLHPTAAGMRIIGPANAALLTQTTPPTITTPTTYTQYESQKMLIELTANEYVNWSLPAGESNYELVWVGDTASGVGLTRLRCYLRWILDGTKTPGTYSTTITAKDGAGNTSSITRTDTVLAAYGSSSSGAVTHTFKSTSTVVYTTQTSLPTFPATFPALSGADTEPAPIFGAGLNLLVITCPSAAITDVVVNGVHGVRIDGDTSTANRKVYAIPLGQGGQYRIQIYCSASTSISNLKYSVVTLTNSKSTPTTVGIVTSAIGTIASSSQTVLTGGSIIATGAAFAGDTITAPSVFDNGPSANFIAHRDSSGTIAISGSGASRQIISMAFDQA